MEHFAFIFTIFFMLLGPIKIIPTFATLTHGKEQSFKRRLASQAIVLAILLVAFVAFAGGFALERYQISLNALRIAGGLVLVVAALNMIFRPLQDIQAKPGATLLEQAASPLAVPVIVPPSGVAAILIFVMLAPDYPGTWLAIAVAIAVIMALNFAVMHFIDFVLKTPGLMPGLHVLGATLIFIQVCIGVELLLRAFKNLGLIAVHSHTVG